MKAKLSAAIAAGSLILAVLAVAATGALQEERQVINACRNSVGLLRMVDDPTDCLRNETLVSWNVVGPQGEPGVAGADGAVGPQGPPGEVSTIDDFTGDTCTLFGRTGEVYVTHSDFASAIMCFVQDDDDAAARNETPETATQIMPTGPPGIVQVARRTMYPVDDVDWYVIPANVFPASSSVSFAGFQPSLHVQIYRDGTSAAELVQDADGSNGPLYRHTVDGQQHTWYLRITRSDPTVPVLFGFYVQQVS